MPHAGYPEIDLELCYDQLNYVIDNVSREGRHIIVGGDFQIELDFIIHRGALIRQ